MIGPDTMKSTKVPEERPLAMNAVEGLGLGARQMHHARGDDFRPPASKRDRICR